MTTNGRRSFLEAVFAFLALPGMVAFVIPWLLRPAVDHVNVVGVPILLIGIVLLLWCVRDFYVAGRGTLAPWAPPERLVIVGLYRLSRNPMYIAVLTVLIGWATMYTSRTLAIYSAFIATAFHLRVVLAEEPWLASTHGEEWTRYRARVPRWLGIASLRPRSSDPQSG